MKNQSLNFKVNFIIAVLILGGGLIGFTGIYGMEKINENTTSITDVNMVKSKLAASITDGQRMVASHMKDLVIATEPGLRNRHHELYKKSQQTLMDLVNEYHKMGSSEEKKLAEKYLASARKWFSEADAVVQFGLNNKLSEASKHIDDVLSPLVSEIRGRMTDINEHTEKILQMRKEHGIEIYKNARNWISLISLISVVTGLGIAYLVLSSMRKSLAQVIDSLTDSSTQVTSAAQQIASSSEELSQAATEQASSLEETAASIEEMNSIIHNNSENAKRTSDLSQMSFDKAQKGREVVQDMIKAIDEISSSNQSIMDQVKHGNNEISNIVRVIAEIGEKTRVINDIVFQTKLLSFNASVEAARAGEHGKGFAVVAEEVGNLAQMSGKAAQEITQLLDESIQKVERIVNETQSKVGSIIVDGKSKVETGSSIARQCGQVLNEIVDNVNSVSRMAKEISSACHEQSIGAQGITRAMNQLDQVTQTNAATSEESASAAEELSSQAESLRATVDLLFREINGGKASRTQEIKTRPKVFSKKTQPVESNVINFKVPEKVNYKKAQKVAGMEGSIPLEDDPRFEEI